MVDRGRFQGAIKTLEEALPALLERRGVDAAEAARLAPLLAADMAATLCDQWGGAAVYIPRPDIQRDREAQKLAARLAWAAGLGYWEIARQHDVTESTVRRWIRDTPSGFFDSL